MPTEWTELGGDSPYAAQLRCEDEETGVIVNVMWRRDNKTDPVVFLNDNAVAMMSREYQAAWKGETLDPTTG